VNPRFQRSSVVSVVLTAIVLLSCARPQPSATRETVVQETKVVKAWNKNASVLESIIAGKSFQQEAFSQAVTFFEESTGIPSRDGSLLAARRAASGRAGQSERRLDCLIG